MKLYIHSDESRHGHSAFGVIDLSDFSYHCISEELIEQAVEFDNAEVYVNRDCTDLYIYLDNAESENIMEGTMITAFRNGSFNIGGCTVSFPNANFDGIGFDADVVSTVAISNSDGRGYVIEMELVGEGAVKVNGEYLFQSIETAINPHLIFTLLHNDEIFLVISDSYQELTVPLAYNIKTEELRLFDIDEPMKGIFAGSYFDYGADEIYSLSNAKPVLVSKYLTMK